MPKTLRYTATVEFIVEERDIEGLSINPEIDLVGELVKVKSGALENLVYGDITSVARVVGN